MGPPRTQPSPPAQRSSAVEAGVRSPPAYLRQDGPGWEGTATVYASVCLNLSKESPKTAVPSLCGTGDRDSHEHLTPDDPRRS